MQAPTKECLKKEQWISTTGVKISTINIYNDA